MTMDSRFFFAIVIIIPLLPFAACSTGKQGGPRTVPVATAQADLREVPLQLRAIGTVEPNMTVTVRSLVGGEIAEVFIREGQNVKQGDRLFQIDPRPFEAALRQAEANLARDRAQAKNAELEAQRYAALAEKGFVSKQEYDRARTGFDALQAMVQADEAAREKAKLDLEFTTATAPISGQTGALLAKKGSVVKANETQVVVINQLSPILVSFSVPEQDLAAVKRYRAAKTLLVEALVPQSGLQPSRGTLTFIDNTVNTSTGAITMKASFPNSDRALWPGQFTDVVLTLTREQGRVAVPAQAVQTGQQGSYVFVVKEDRTVEMRSVGAGRTVDGWTVIDQGLTPGETVVTEGQLRLTPGAKVEIKNEKTNQDEQKAPEAKAGSKK